MHGVTRRRILSWLWDYLVVLGLLAAVFVVVGVPASLGWLHLGWMRDDPVLTDVFITLLTVVPFLAYLAGTESGTNHATWGKRREQLAVFAPDHGLPGGGAILIRNLIKLLPWQFGHMGALRVAASKAPSPGAVVFLVMSLAMLVAVAGPPLLGRRGIHDVVAGTVVLGSGKDRPPSRGV